MRSVLPQELFDRGAFLIFAKDASRRYVYANPRACEELGITPEGHGVRDEDLFPPEVAERLREHDKAVLSWSVPRMDEERLPLRGQERTYLVSRFPLTEEDGEAVLGMVAFEITQRAQAEGNLLASHALFKGILDIAVDAIISIDAEQRIVLFNQGAERIFGYSADEVMGQPLNVLLPHPSRGQHQHHVVQFGHSGGGARRMGERGTISGRRKDGTVFPAEASISRVVIDGRVTFTAILRDVTEAREAEGAINALNNDLKQRASQLEAANRELEAFSYSVSHDLRAPLRSIDGFSQVLLEDFADRLTDEAQDSLQRIRAASQRMSQLIDDMLTLSRLTRGSVNRSDIDLSRVAASIVEDLRNRDPQRQVEAKIAEGVRGHADPHLMHAALGNLLENAWKFTGRHPLAHIEFGSYQDAKGRTVYFVRDDGAGFDMAYAGKLFGAFQRLHAMGDFSGTGVGLATVQRVIHKHGGEVWANAAVGQGATFYFTLG